MVFLEYTATSDSTTGNTFGYRKGIVNMIQPITFDPNKKKAYQVQSVILSPEIPNVYNYDGFDNTKVKISNDGGTTWVTVQFPNGIYQINMIEATVTNAFLQAGWIPDETFVPIVIDYNPATRLVYIQVDTTKLSVGTQAAVDFGASQMYRLLGFPTAVSAKFLLDGTFSATLAPEVDTQGTYINVVCNAINASRFINGQLSNVIAKVPIVNSGNGIEIVFPSASTGSINTPFIEASIANYLPSFTIDFLQPNGKSAVFLYGNAIVQLIIQDIDGSRNM